jgi:hypothetical protein
MFNPSRLNCYQKYGQQHFEKAMEELRTDNCLYAIKNLKSWMLSAAIRVQMNCGYCGKQMQAFCILRSRDSMPGLTPSFCSTKCADSFFEKSELRQSV